MESRHIRRRFSGSDKRNVEELQPLGSGAGNAALTHACQHSRQTSCRRHGDPEVLSLITDNCKAFASVALTSPPPTLPPPHPHPLHPRVRTLTYSYFNDTCQCGAETDERRPRPHLLNAWRPHRKGGAGGCGCGGGLPSSRRKKNERKRLKRLDRQFCLTRRRSLKF